MFTNKMEPGVFVSAIGGLALLLAGCISIDGNSGGGGGSVRVTPELFRVGDAGAVAKAAAREDTAGDPHWTSALNLLSVKTPIVQISLLDANGGHQVDLYRCDAGNDGCLVELTTTALQDLLNATPDTIPSGKYSQLYIGSCFTEGQASNYVTATTTLNGATWYTDSAAILNSVGPATPVRVVQKDCGHYFALPHPVNITDALGASVVLRMYFDLTDIAFAALGSPQTAHGFQPDDCAGTQPAFLDSTSSPYLCLSYPDVSGLIDSVTPHLEQYRIDGGATLGLFFTAVDDIPIGGYFRNYYDEGVNWNTPFQAVSSLRDFINNGDSTYQISEPGPSQEVPTSFDAPAFRRETHDGPYTYFDFSNSLGLTLSGTYHAVKLDP